MSNKEYFYFTMTNCYGIENIVKVETQKSKRNERERKLMIRVKSWWVMLPMIERVSIIDYKVSSYLWIELSDADKALIRLHFIKTLEKKTQ